MVKPIFQLVDGDKVCLNFNFKSAGGYMEKWFINKKHPRINVNWGDGRWDGSPSKDIIIFLKNPYKKWFSGLREMIEMDREDSVRSIYGFDESKEVRHSESVEYSFHILEMFLERIHQNYYSSDNWERKSQEDYITKVGLDFCDRIFNIKYDKSWMISPHTMVDDYTQNLVSLWELEKYKNVYFTDLDNLSKPNFISWLCDKDNSWDYLKESSKDVDWFKIQNPTPPYFWEQLSILLERLKVVNKDETYIDFININGEQARLLNDVENINVKFLSIVRDQLVRSERTIDFIKNNSERYLKFN